MKTSLPLKSTTPINPTPPSTSHLKPKQSSYPSKPHPQSPLLPLKTQQNLSKKTLVLDLDETLVHSIFKPLPHKPPNITLPISSEGELKHIYVYTRPFVHQFLKELSQHFEIVIFTASLRKYAIPLLSELDKHNYCTHFLFREHCSVFNGSIYKDITRLGRDIKDIIIVDNNPHCYALHASNGINIKSWINDFDDNELERILPVLKYINKNYSDVREGIKLMKDEQGYFSYEKAEKIINEHNKGMLLKNNHTRILTAPFQERQQHLLKNTFLQIPYMFKKEENTPKKVKVKGERDVIGVLSRSVRNGNMCRSRICHYRSNCRTIDYSLDKENISKLALVNNEINSFRHSSKKVNKDIKPNWVYETKNNLIGEYYMNSTMPNTFRNKNNNPLRLLYQNNRENKSIAVTKIGKGGLLRKFNERECKSLLEKDNIHSYPNGQILNSKGCLYKCSISNKVKVNLKLQ